MRRNVLLLTSLLVFAFTVSGAYAADVVIKEQPKKIIRLYREGLPEDVDLTHYLETGEVVLLSGEKLLPPKITPGPAPPEYSHVHMWEPGVEQLGPTPDNCDGIWFINGNLWHPKKWALVCWKIMVPQSRERYSSEFCEDLTMSLWVDWNQDMMWGRNEQVLCEHLNIEEYIPSTLDGYVEIWYLTMFRVPRATSIDALNGWDPRYVTKLWARGILSYHDPDTSPGGECLFGEVEDYLVNYFEIKEKSGKKE